MPGGEWGDIKQNKWLVPPIAGREVLIWDIIYMKSGPIGIPQMLKFKTHRHTSSLKTPFFQGHVHSIHLPSVTMYPHLPSTGIARVKQTTTTYTEQEYS